ncbi:MAG: hypothetical protein DRJ32_01440 [Thermoprotei archaeon]|nr:MAG: hypothetical protein B6U94_00805 [Thermofilum sp. ex4484_79]RLE61301.1 MAG: hypothetical protein DRJ32_01440 [Thermoprotei archaeon]
MILLFEAIIGYLLITATVITLKRSSFSTQRRLVKLLASYIIISLIISFYLTITYSYIQEIREFVSLLEILASVVLHIIMVIYAWFLLTKVLS